MIQCEVLFEPQTLLIESENIDCEENLHDLFMNENLSSMKYYPHCAFLHFHSNAG